MFELLERKKTKSNIALMAVTNLTEAFASIMSMLAGEKGCQREIFNMLRPAFDELIRKIRPCLSHCDECNASFPRNSYPVEVCGLAEDSYQVIETVVRVLETLAPLMDNDKTEDDNKPHQSHLIQQAIRMLEELYEVRRCMP